MKTAFKAFSNPLITKERMLFHLKQHQKQDDFIRGTYGLDNKHFTKGCAVGCTINSINRELGLELKGSNHKTMEEYAIVPEWLARFEDRIFEGVSVERSKTWPVEFIEAINKGADLNKIKAPLIVFILESVLGYVQDKKHQKQKDVVLRCIKLWQRNDIGSIDWELERKTVKSYAAAADAAYADAAAAAAAAAYAAADAAYDAYAAAAAAAAVYAAAYAAAAAYYTSVAASVAARIKKYEMFADKALELIRDCHE